jgi:transitional endoplasmic reticulum ATPase
MPLAQDVSLEKIADITHGYVGADLEALGREAAMTCLRDTTAQKNFRLEDIPEEVIESLEVTQEHFLKAMNDVINSFLYR